MSDVVLDASVVLKWFGRRGEQHETQALEVRSAYDAGALTVLTPPLLALEIVNVAGRRWRSDESLLIDLAADVEALGFEVREARLEGIARWTARGLSAYDSAYVALAEETGAKLVTDDTRVLSLASGVTIGLINWRRTGT